MESYLVLYSNSLFQLWTYYQTMIIQLHVSLAHRTREFLHNQLEKNKSYFLK